MPDKALTPRELDCLNWSALGKTSWETSMILGLSERTVNFHIQNACAKLGAGNRRTAVVTAMRQGLLTALEVKWPAEQAPDPGPQ